MKTLNQVIPSALLTTTFLVAPFIVTTIAVAQEEDVIVVRGVNIPDEKKSTSEISSLLDEEAFTRQGDSDVAGALARVTGLSITDGKFVVARGLNERYNNATLNGSPLPSPEPLKRTVPLDLFPTSILRGTLVQKTFSPQYSGEFGGAMIDLRTKTVPNDDFMEAKIQFGANTVTTIQEGLFYEGSDTDVWGFDDGLRDLPEFVQGQMGPQINNLTPNQQNIFDTSFEQRDTLLINRGETPGNGKVSLAFGKVFDENDNYQFGTTTFVSYANDWQTRRGKRQRPESFNGTNYNFGEDERIQSKYLSTEQEINLSLLNSSGIEFGTDHEIALTSLVVRKSSKQAKIEEGVNFDDISGERYRKENTDFVERQVWQSQLAGEHSFADMKDLEVDWRLAHGQATRNAPYERQTTYSQRGGNTTYTFRDNIGANNAIIFSEVYDENLSGGVDFVLPLEVNSRALDISFGAAFTDNSRTTKVREFNILGDFPTEIEGSRADLVFSDAVLGLSGPNIQLQSTAGAPDNFAGSLETAAAYVLADFEVGDFFRFALGGRYEDSTQEVSTFVTDTLNSAQRFAPLEGSYFLPAATVTWIPSGNFQLRAGYSQTITRPQFRELSPSYFRDRDTDTRYYGNPFLQNTEFENFDARAEWYFSRGEFLTAGVFYKDIKNPIEEFIVTLGDSNTTSFLNAPSATTYGVEFEFEKDFELGDITDSDWGYGKDLVFKTNYTWTDSDVNSAGTVSIARPGQNVIASQESAAAFIEDGSLLQGQAEHLFNIQLGLNDPENGLEATILANYASENIRFRGESTGNARLPDIMTEPSFTVDLVINQDLRLFNRDDFVMGVKLQNLTGEDYNLTRTDQLRSFDYEQYDKGRSISVSLSKKF
ncbi:MAG: TonB-dependent receptor domain-containing protein [bacterium]